MKLKISHFPQIPCKAFEVEVETVLEANNIINILADYDNFQFENKIKPDYCNSTVLEMWDEEEGEWISWYDEETGIDDVEEYLEFIKEE